MNRTKTRLWGHLAGALAISGAACGVQSLSPPGGAGGRPGVPNDASVVQPAIDGSPGVLFPLPSSATGFVDDLVTGVVGNWFSFGDSVGPNANLTTTDFVDSDCAKAGFPMASCSQITSPTPGQPFPPSDPATSKMCTSGTAALVQNQPGSTAADYTDMWGAGIGLNFNYPDPGFDGGVPLPLYFDLSRYRGIAFDFSGNIVPPHAMRASFTYQGMHGGDSPYWMGATSESSPLTGTTASPQHVEIDWADVGGPLYLTQMAPAITPPAFDPTKVQAIEFQVFTNAAVSTPYSFCVANLALVKN